MLNKTDAIPKAVTQSENDTKRWANANFLAHTSLKRNISLREFEVENLDCPNTFKLKRKRVSIAMMRRQYEGTRMHQKKRFNAKSTEAHPKKIWSLCDKFENVVSSMDSLAKQEAMDGYGIQCQEDSVSLGHQ